MLKNITSNSTRNATKPAGSLALSLAFTLLVAPAVLPAPAFAQEGIRTFGYFTNAQMTGVPDARMSVVNPGSVNGFSPAGDLCANIYVFASDQQLIECCSCIVTPDGLRTFSVNTDLTNNPLIAAVQHSGPIKIVSSAVVGNDSCKTTTASGFPVDVAATAYRPAGLLGAWITHVNDSGNGTFGVSETNFFNGPIAATELTKLQQQCYEIESVTFGGLGAAHGICTCGTE